MRDETSIVVESGDAAHPSIMLEVRGDSDSKDDASRRKSASLHIDTDIGIDESEDDASTPETPDLNGDEKRHGIPFSPPQLSLGGVDEKNDIDDDIVIRNEQHTFKELSLSIVEAPPEQPAFDRLYIYPIPNRNTEIGYLLLSPKGWKDSNKVAVDEKLALEVFSSASPSLEVEAQLRASILADIQKKRREVGVEFLPKIKIASHRQQWYSEAAPLIWQAMMMGDTNALYYLFGPYGQLHKRDFAIHRRQYHFEEFLAKGCRELSTLSLNTLQSYRRKKQLELAIKEDYSTRYHTYIAAHPSEPWQFETPETLLERFQKLNSLWMKAFAHYPFSIVEGGERGLEYDLDKPIAQLHEDLITVYQTKFASNLPDLDSLPPLEWQEFIRTMEQAWQMSSEIMAANNKDSYYTQLPHGYEYLPRHALYEWIITVQQKAYSETGMQAVGEMRDYLAQRDKVLKKEFGAASVLAYNRRLQELFKRYRQTTKTKESVIDLTVRTNSLSLLEQDLILLIKNIEKTEKSLNLQSIENIECWIETTYPGVKPKAPHFIAAGHDAAAEDNSDARYTRILLQLGTNFTDKAIAWWADNWWIYHDVLPGHSLFLVKESVKNFQINMSPGKIYLYVEDEKISYKILDMHQKTIFQELVQGNSVGELSAAYYQSLLSRFKAFDPVAEEVREELQDEPLSVAILTVLSQHGHFKMEHEYRYESRAKQWYLDLIDDESLFEEDIFDAPPRLYDVVDKDGNNLLFSALFLYVTAKSPEDKIKYLSVVLAVTDAGVNPYAKNRFGQTPLEAASLHKVSQHIASATSTAVVSQAWHIQQAFLEQLQLRSQIAQGLFDILIKYTQKTAERLEAFAKSRKGKKAARQAGTANQALKTLQEHRLKIIEKLGEILYVNGDEISNDLELIAAVEACLKEVWPEKRFKTSKLKVELQKFLKACYAGTNHSLRTGTTIVEYAQYQTQMARVKQIEQGIIAIRAERDLIYATAERVKVHDRAISDTKQELSQVKQAGERTKEILEQKLEASDHRLKVSEETCARLGTELAQTRVDSQKAAQRLQQLESIVQKLVLAQGVIPVAAPGAISAPATATRVSSATPTSTDYSGVSPRLFVVSTNTAVSVPPADSKKEAATSDGAAPATTTDVDDTAVDAASASCS